MRTLKAEIRDRVFEQLNGIADALARQHGAKIKVNLEFGYPATVNHAAETDFASAVASEVVGSGRVDQAVAPMMGGEDFSYMLQARPGAFIFIGNGETAGLHHPAYDFNDAAIPAGVSYWVKLIETALPA